MLRAGGRMLDRAITLARAELDVAVALRSAAMTAQRVYMYVSR